MIFELFVLHFSFLFSVAILSKILPFNSTYPGAQLRAFTLGLHSVLDSLGGVFIPVCFLIVSPLLVFSIGLFHTIYSLLFHFALFCNYFTRGAFSSGNVPCCRLNPIPYGVFWITHTWGEGDSACPPVTQPF